MKLCINITIVFTITIFQVFFFLFHFFITILGSLKWMRMVVIVCKVCNCKCLPSTECPYTIITPLLDQFFFFCCCCCFYSHYSFYSSMFSHYGKQKFVVAYIQLHSQCVKQLSCLYTTSLDQFFLVFLFGMNISPGYSSYLATKKEEESERIKQICRINCFFLLLLLYDFAKTCRTFKP